MPRRRSPPPHPPPRQLRSRKVRRGCPFTRWRGGRWRWRVWPGSCGRGLWRHCWRWRVWVSGWCWRVGGWCRRRGVRGGRCPAGRRAEPASPASPARGPVAGVSEWGASSHRVPVVGPRRLGPRVPVDLSNVPVDLSAPHAAQGGPVFPYPVTEAVRPGWDAARRGTAGPPAAREGVGCPGPRVAPRRQRGEGVPALVAHRRAWRGAGPTAATIKPGGTERAAEGWH